MTTIRIGRNPTVEIDVDTRGVDVSLEGSLVWSSSDPIVDGGERITIVDFFNGVGFETEQGRFGVARRDSGIEVVLDGELVWSSTTNPTPDATIASLRDGRTAEAFKGVVERVFADRKGELSPDEAERAVEQVAELRKVDVNEQRRKRALLDTVTLRVGGCLEQWIIDGRVDDPDGQLKSDLEGTVRGAFYESALAEPDDKPRGESLSACHCPHCGRVYAENADTGDEACGYCGGELYPVARRITAGKEIQAGDGVKVITLDEALKRRSDEAENERSNAIAFAGERNEARAERDEALVKVEALAALLEAKGTVVKGWLAGTPITDEVRQAPYAGPVVNVTFAQGTDAAQVQRGIEAMFAAASGTADANAVAAAEHRRLSKLLDAHNVIAVEERIVWNPRTGVDEPQRHNLSTVARVGKVVDEVKQRRAENRANTANAERIAKLEQALEHAMKSHDTGLQAVVEMFDDLLDKAGVPEMDPTTKLFRPMEMRLSMLVDAHDDMKRRLKEEQDRNPYPGTDTHLIERRLVEEAREWIATVDVATCCNLAPDDGTSDAAASIVERLDAVLDREPEPGTDEPVDPDNPIPFRPVDPEPEPDTANAFFDKLAPSLAEHEPLWRTEARRFAQAWLDNRNPHPGTVNTDNPIDLAAALLRPLVSGNTIVELANNAAARIKELRLQLQAEYDKAHEAQATATSTLAALEHTEHQLRTALAKLDAAKPTRTDEPVDPEPDTTDPDTK